MAVEKTYSLNFNYFWSLKVETMFMPGLLNNLIAHLSNLLSGREILYFFVA